MFLRSDDIDYSSEPFCGRRSAASCATTAPLARPNPRQSRILTKRSPRSASLTNCDLGPKQVDVYKDLHGDICERQSVWDVQ
jgi:hypothetical protein